MAEYLMLFRFTKQGIEKIKDGPNRLKNARKIFENAGAKIKTFYLLLGQYDSVCIVEAPNDETIARLSLQIGSQGNVRTESLRAFSEDQFLEMINKLA